MKELKFFNQWLSDVSEKKSSSSIDAALRKKSEKSGIAFGILKSVFNRGMAAWKSGHRPGAGQEQWGFARVNSFITKGSGTWGKADADLAKRVRKKKKVNEGGDAYFKGLSDSTIKKKKAQMKKQASMQDNDPSAYKEMPGDKKGKKTMQVSKHTKKYHDMYGD
jgi:hypothetical protein